MFAVDVKQQHNNNNFYGSLILPFISNTVNLINIILGIVGKYDTMNDFILVEVTLTYISSFSDFI